MRACGKIVPPPTQRGNGFEGYSLFALAIETAVIPGLPGLAVDNVPAKLRIVPSQLDPLRVVLAVLLGEIEMFALGALQLDERAIGFLSGHGHFPDCVQSIPSKARPAGLSLSRLESRILLVDEVQSALASNHLAVLVTLLRRTQRVANLHGMLLLVIYLILCLNNTPIGMKMQERTVTPAGDQGVAEMTQL